MAAYHCGVCSADLTARDRTMGVVSHPTTVLDTPTYRCKPHAPPRERDRIRDAHEGSLGGVTCLMAAYHCRVCSTDLTARDRTMGVVSHPPHGAGHAHIPL